MKYDEINFDIYRRAFHIYLDIAYPNGVKKNNFCYKNIRLIQKARSLAAIKEIFDEKKILIDKNFEIRKYVVRMGSEKYPFLKLVLQEAESAGDFGFLVDRHTEYLALASSSKTFDEEKAVKEYTRKIKIHIENEFERSGVPTYREIIKQFTKRLLKVRENIEIKHNGIKVLLVDDDLDVLKLDKLSLEILGYSVSEAYNGEDAIKKVETEKNDIMMLDMLMPTISGFEVINRVSNKIPIIVLSSLSDDMSKKICLDGGAKAILTKPVETHILDNCIRQVLNIKF